MPAPVTEWDKYYIPEPNSGCWIWLRFLTPQGYGQTSWRRRRILAHRLFWQLFKGGIPQGMGVLHHCDNPACVNPDHLFLGDQRANIIDMVTKGRWGVRNLPRGAKHHRSTAKLTIEDVEAIRADSTRSRKELACLFDVSPSLISRILAGTLWQEY